MAPRHQRTPRRCAHRTDVVLIELDALLRQPIDIRCPNVRPVIPYISPAQIIREDIQNVRFIVCHYCHHSIDVSMCFHLFLNPFRVDRLDTVTIPKVQEPWAIIRCPVGAHLRIVRSGKMFFDVLPFAPNNPEGVVYYSPGLFATLGTETSRQPNGVAEYGTLEIDCNFYQSYTYLSSKPTLCSRNNRRDSS